MSNGNLPDLVAVERTDVIPGRVLSPLRVKDYGTLQRHFEATYLRVAALASEGLPEAAANRLLSKAQDYITDGRFRFGTAEFDAALFSIDHLPLLLHLALQLKHPDSTPATAELLITDANRYEVRNACMELAGYGVSKKKEATVIDSRPTGEASTAHSEPKA